MCDLFCIYKHMFLFFHQGLQSNPNFDAFSDLATPIEFAHQIQTARKQSRNSTIQGSTRFDIQFEWLKTTSIGKSYARDKCLRSRFRPTLILRLLDSDDVISTNFNNITFTEVSSARNLVIFFCGCVYSFANEELNVRLRTREGIITRKILAKSMARASTLSLRRRRSPAQAPTAAAAVACAAPAASA